MKPKTIKIIVAFSIFMLSGASALLAGDAEKGKKLALSKSDGNCLACHKIAGADQPGNIGPELVDMKSRYPNKADIRARIWDATRFNPISAMPPFGRNRIMTEQEIDDLAEFISTL